MQGERRARIVRGESGGGSWEMAVRAPRPDLRRYIRDYCGYSEVAPGPVRRLECPGPQVVVIIEFGPPVRVFDSWQPRASAVYPGGFVAGIDARSSVVEHQGRQSGLQLNLTPIGGRLFFGLPMSELACRVVPLADLLGSPSGDLAGLLQSLPGWDARFDWIERLVAARVERRPARTSTLEWAYGRIEDSGGAVDMRELARELGYSQKHVISLFRDHVGVPPKLLARIVRFDRLVRYLRRGGDGHWAELALRFGYYDQSHLVRDSQQFTGTTPTRLRAMLFSLPGSADPEEVNSFQERIEPEDVQLVQG